MDQNEARYHLVSALLQADGPLTFEELLERSGLDAADARPAVEHLIRRNLAVAGELVAGRPSPQYCWRDRWDRQVGRRAAGKRRKVTSAVAPSPVLPEWQLDVDSEPSRAFHDYVIGDYRPPKGKRFCVFFQCSVRRPFSRSPSHATMRKAIRLATGLDPAKDFEGCPVHVVVMASRVGPVPYELEDVYPANVRGGGVKHFRPEHYERVRPLLARRMADYITTHGGGYERTASFTQGRYAEVMRDAMRIAGADFPVFPDPQGAICLPEEKRCQYWVKYWIQLFLEIVGWLGPDQREQAEARLAKAKVEYRLRPTRTRKRRR